MYLFVYFYTLKITPNKFFVNSTSFNHLHVIPAFDGMTLGAGMTEKKAGMTIIEKGITRERRGVKNPSTARLATLDASLRE